MPLNYKLIGRNIRESRRSHDLTQEKLAEITGLSVNHVSHIEIGSAPLSLPALVSICEALSTTADRLLYDTLTQPTAYMDADVAACFAGTTPHEGRVMLAVALAAKEVMRAEKQP